MDELAGRLRPRSDRAADPQRARRRPGVRQSVVDRAALWVPAGGRAPLRLGAARSRARVAPAGRLADRHRRRQLDLSRLCAARDRRPRSRVRPDGRYAVRIGAADIGTGTWTALAQIAADALGCPGRGHSAGDRRYRLCPMATVAGGSSGITSWGSAIVAAARAFRAPQRPRHGAEAEPPETPEDAESELRACIPSARNSPRCG